MKTKKTKATGDREFLTFKQAAAMLADGDKIHVVTNPAAGVMLGADWTRADVLKRLRDGKPELAGTIATATNHGIALEDGERFLWIQTKGGAA